MSFQKGKSALALAWELSRKNRPTPLKALGQIAALITSQREEICKLHAAINEKNRQLYNLGLMDPSELKEWLKA